MPDLSPLYSLARLTLNALRSGAGVKGKIIARLQAGVPVVTTPVGNEGLRLEHDGDALIGDTAEALAGHAVRLLRDAALCARLAEAGASFCRQRFGDRALRHGLLWALERDLCPVCGSFGPADAPALVCGACGADELDRALADAALRPWQPIAVASLREAAPLLGRAALPPGPLAEQTGHAEPAGPLDLLVCRADPDPARVRPGGRLVAPRFDVAGLLSSGWDVRLHEAGPAIVEATRPLAQA